MRRRILLLLLRRLAMLVPILFGIVTVTFFATRVIPGDPAVLVAGEFATKDQVAEIRRQLGTDVGLWEQYTRYLGKVIRLDFGESIFTSTPVAHELGHRLPATLELVVLALLLAVAIGLPAGAWAARHARSAGDRTIRTLAFLLLSLPEFWFGLVLAYVFFFRLGWAPSPSGQLGFSLAPPPNRSGAALIDGILAGDGTVIGDAAAHLVLPVLTLGLVFAAPVSRLARSAVLEATATDFVRFAYASGLRPKYIRRYTLRGALPPILTFVAIMFTALIGGAVVVETVFAWGGAASFVAEAIVRKDFATVQGFVLVSGVISVVVFFLVDILYMVVDPRVRL